jgi:hypothetical protein
MAWAFGNPVSANHHLNLFAERPTMAFDNPLLNNKMVSAKFGDRCLMPDGRASFSSKGSSHNRANRHQYFVIFKP